MNIMKYNLGEIKNMQDAPQIRNLKPGLFFLILVLFTAVLFLNRFIVRQVEDASLTFEQSTVHPAKLEISHSQRKAVPLDALDSSGQEGDLEPMPPATENNEKKNKRVIYEMPLNDEALPQ